MDEKVSGFMWCSGLLGMPHRYVSIYKEASGRYYVSIDNFRSEGTFLDTNNTKELWKCIKEVEKNLKLLRGLDDHRCEGGFEERGRVCPEPTTREFSEGD